MNGRVEWAATRSRSSWGRFLGPGGGQDVVFQAGCGVWDGGHSDLLSVTRARGCCQGPVGGSAGYVVSGWVALWVAARTNPAGVAVLLHKVGGWIRLSASELGVRYIAETRAERRLTFHTRAAR